MPYDMPVLMPHDRAAAVEKIERQDLPQKLGHSVIRLKSEENLDEVELRAVAQSKVGCGTFFAAVLCIITVGWILARIAAANRGLIPSFF